jgi:hypothetical protein
MSQQRLPPPCVEACLVLSRVSSQKGGTLIAEGVADLATHEALVCDPDGYRPPRCPRCGGTTLHVHDYLVRQLRSEGECVVVRLIRYICAAADCGATWRMLPAFIARHLWRAWPVVERTVIPRPPQEQERPTGGPCIAKSTVRRWVARLDSSARQLVALLAASRAELLEEIADRVGLDAVRYALVEVHSAIVGADIGARLGTLAALTHRLERGIRLM